MQPAREGEKVELFYLSAPDCPWCAVWSNYGKPGFLSSEAAQRLTFRQIDLPALRSAFSSGWGWPDEIKELRPAIISSGQRRGLPFFILMRDQTPVLGVWGTAAWDSEMLRTIKQLTGTA